MGALVGIEVFDLLQFVMGRLKGDATLMSYLPGGVYHGSVGSLPTPIAPVGYPHGVINVLSVTPWYALGAEPYYARVVFDFLAVTKNTAPGTLKTAVQRAHTLLHDAHGTTANGAKIAMYWESGVAPVWRKETEEHIFWYIGNLYAAELDD